MTVGFREVRWRPSVTVGFLGIDLGRYLAIKRPESPLPLRSLHPRRAGDVSIE